MPPGRLPTVRRSTRSAGGPGCSPDRSGRRRTPMSSWRRRARTRAGASGDADEQGGLKELEQRADFRTHPVLRPGVSNHNTVPGLSGRAYDAGWPGFTKGLPDGAALNFTLLLNVLSDGHRDLPMPNGPGVLRWPIAPLLHLRAPFRRQRNANDVTPPLALDLQTSDPHGSFRRSTRAPPSSSPEVASGVADAKALSTPAGDPEDARLLDRHP